MSETKPKLLPASLQVSNADLGSALSLLGELLTTLSGNIGMLHDVECEIRIDGAKASLRFRAC